MRYRNWRNLGFKGHLALQEKNHENRCVHSEKLKYACPNLEGGTQSKWEMHGIHWSIEMPMHLPIICAAPIQTRKEEKLCGLPWIWEFMFQCVQMGIYKITKSRHNEGKGYKCFAFKARVLRLIFQRSIMKVLSDEVQFCWELK